MFLSKIQLFHGMEETEVRELLQCLGAEEAEI